MRPDFIFEVFAVHGLNFACNFQGNSGALRDVDGNVRSLDGSDSSDEAEIALLVLHQLIEAQINSVMDGAQFRQ